MQDLASLYENNSESIQEEDDGFHSDGRKKSTRKVEDNIPIEKAFKVPNTH